MSVKRSEGDVQKRPRGRPPNPETRRAVLVAARELLAELGPMAMTIERIAERSGVSRPTIYRWWPDRHAVVMAALMDEEHASSNEEASKSPLRALRHQVQEIVARFGTPTGRHLSALIAAADSESEVGKAFRNHFVLTRRAEGKKLLQAAIERGDIDPKADVDVLLDAIYGALFFRLLIGHASLDVRFAERVLEAVLAGSANPERTSTRGSARKKGQPT